MKKIKYFCALAIGMAFFGGIMAEEGDIVPQKLTNEFVPLLEGVLKKRIWVVGRIITAFNNINYVEEKVGEYVPKIDSMNITEEKKNQFKNTVVKKLRTLVIIPVKQFFKTLYDFRGWLEPIVKESLGRADIGFEKSLLYRFLKMDLSKASSAEKENRISAFFESEITTVDEILNACREFKILFVDLEISMEDIFAEGYVFLEGVESGEIEDHNPDDDNDDDIDKPSEA